MTRLRANSLLLITAVIWGSACVAQQVVLEHLGPLLFTGVRFLLGAIVIAPLAYREYQTLRSQASQLDRNDITGGLTLGTLLFLGCILQQIGIGTTTITNAGFLTALYVPLVPCLAWIFQRQRPHITTWPSVAACLCGIWLLSGGHLDKLGTGDYWVIASAFFWALHVLYVGHLAASKGTPVLVAATQFTVCGGLALIGSLMTESTVPLSSMVSALPAILYGGVLSVGVGYTLQVVAQRHTGTADAAILLSAETLFAGLAGAFILNERLLPLQLAGCSLIFASILAVQLIPLFMPRRKAQGKELTG